MATPRKLSVFAQRMQNKKMKLEENKETESVFNADVSNKSLISRSNILTGSDAKSIHEENMKKLAEMSMGQIEEERRKLLVNLDPSMVEFLRSKKSPCVKLQSDDWSSKAKIRTHSPIECCEPDHISSLPVAGLVNRFPHMDRVEPEKLEWMEPVPPPSTPDPQKPYNARFNFDGELLGYAEEVGEGRGLHHHGDEPSRPGYTIQELTQLSRSSVLQQRVTAVATLANVFRKAASYDRYLTEPLLPRLLESEMLLLVRFSLDDAARSVVCAAAAALSALMANVHDEGCLDRLLGLSTGLRQPNMFVELDLKPEEEAELKDAELLKVDVVKGVLRTRLLPRFRYILEKMDPEPAEVAHIARCLIRIVRHSHDAAVTVTNEPGLLATLRHSLNEPPPFACSDTLKLFRVLACHSRQLASHLVDTYNIVDPVQRFIAGNRKETTMSLVLESFYTWQTLLSYQLTIDQVSAFLPVAQRLLVAHAEATDLSSSAADLEHATALVGWLRCAARADTQVAQVCLPPLRLCALKWLSQAAGSQNIKWAACKLLDSILQFMASLIDSQDMKIAEIEEKVGKFLSSENFKRASQKMSSRSWLLNRDGALSSASAEGLPSLGSIPPTLYDDSPLPLLLGLAVYIYASRSSPLSASFALSDGVRLYAERVVAAGGGANGAHWFARQEIALVYTLLQIHLNTQTPVDSSVLHEAALFLSTSVHADDSYMLPQLFRQVIFNRHFLQPDISDVTAELQKLQLNSHNSENGVGDERKVKLLNEALDSLQTTCSCYLGQLHLGEGVGVAPSYPPSALTSTFRGTEPALPADWPYLPVVQLNNDATADGSEGGEGGAAAATSCLQWTLALEHLRPRWLSGSGSPPAARFCRLACVLLAGNDLFRDIRDLLSENLTAILVHNDQLDFTKPIPGLQSFYDFYRQILEQFVGVSYGDPVFGRFVLAPLQQKHDSRFRKLVWCEMAAALRFLSTPVDQIGVPMKDFLEPCETDPDLLFIYLKALGQGRIRETFCPVLYKVALHHVAMFVSLKVEHPVAKSLNNLIDTLGNQELKNKLRNY